MYFEVMVLGLEVVDGLLPVRRKDLSRWSGKTLIYLLVESELSQLGAG